MGEEEQKNYFCRQCQRTLPRTLEYFSPNTSYKDGMNYLCKTCRAANERERWQQNKENPRPKRVNRSFHAPPDTKYCALCQRNLPRTLEYFYPDGENNFQTWCRACRKTHRRKHPPSEQTHTQTAPPQPAVDHCEICGTSAGFITGDVDEQTHQRYGLLCASCGRMVRNMEIQTKSDKFKIKQFIAYVIRTREIKW